MRHASLFSGIGGFDLAAEAVGWQNLFNCEVNSFCRRILDHYFPNAVGYNDIFDVDFRRWRGQVDVLSGGFPCQPFSLAGNKKGEEDERFLWPQMLRCIDECQPKWIVAENVLGLLSMTQPNDTVFQTINSDLFGNREVVQVSKHDFTVNKILSSLDSRGYALSVFVIPACAVGAPHRRDRVWIVACNDKTVSSVSKRARKGQNKQENSFSWEHFPSHYPLLGSDNIPRQLNDITFTAWRRESVKALGNAIVPKVARKIFSIINSVNN